MSRLRLLESSETVWSVCQGFNLTLKLGNRVVLNALRLLERTEASVQVAQQIVLSGLRLLERGQSF